MKELYATDLPSIWSRNFPEYQVDCEYNLNCDSEDFRKRIPDFKVRLDRLVGPATKEVYGEEAEELPSLVSVYPDIIIHKRGTNENNLLVIELKKSTSRVPNEPDLTKLRTYTKPDATDFHLSIRCVRKAWDIVRKASRRHGKRVFQNGEEIEEPQ